MTDWRYWITYSGVVTTVDSHEVLTAADEQAAIDAALEDVANGKIPEVEVEPLDEGREGE